MTDRRLPGTSSRRSFLGAGGATAATALAACSPGPAEDSQETWKRAVNGRIRHSLCFWCFNTSDWAWDLDTAATHAVELGIESIEDTCSGAMASGSTAWPHVRHCRQRHA